VKNKPARSNGKPQPRHLVAAPPPGTMPGIADLAAQAAQIAHTITPEQKQELVALDQQAARVKIAIANMYLQGLAVKDQLRAAAKQAVEAQNIFENRVKEMADGAGLDTKQTGWMFDFQRGTFNKQA